MNQVILMGRLTKEPELKYVTDDNKPVCKFTIAVPRKFSKENAADFLNIVAWNKLGEFCSKYFHKGYRISIVGSIQIRTYEDKDGKRQYFTEIIAEEAYFADCKHEPNDTSSQDNKHDKKDDPGEQDSSKDNDNKEQNDDVYITDDTDDLPF